MQYAGGHSLQRLMYCRVYPVGCAARLIKTGPCPAPGSHVRAPGVQNGWGGGQYSAPRALQRRCISRKQASVLKYLEDVGNRDDVHVEDLAATLEAHRSTNRASVIRKIDPGDTTLPTPNGNFLRPSIIVNTRSRNGAVDTRLGEAPKHEKTSFDATSRLPGPQEDDTKIAKAVKLGIEKEGNAHKQSHARSLDREARLHDAPAVKVAAAISAHGVSTRQKASDRTRTQTKIDFWNPGAPWLPYMKTLHVEDDRRLSAEISAFEAYMQLSPVEVEASELIISHVKRAVSGVIDLKDLHSIGSRTTGLATPLSDYDFGIATHHTSLGSEPIVPGFSRSLQRIRSIAFLRKLRKSLRSPDFYDVEMIFGRIPLLNAVHFKTGLKLQFQTFGETEPSQALTKSLVHDMKPLRAIFILIRHALQLQGLQVVFEGGVGSYCLFMMIVMALKHTSNQSDPEDLGMQLLHVLNFWISANLKTHGYVVDPPIVFDKLKPLGPVDIRLPERQVQGIESIRKTAGARPDYLCLQNPTDYDSDLGSKSYNISAVIRHFGLMRDEIMKRLHMMRTKKNDALTSGRLALLPLLGNFGLYERRRSRITRYMGVGSSDPNDYSGHTVRREQQDRAVAYRMRNNLPPIVVAGKGYCTSDTISRISYKF